NTPNALPYVTTALPIEQSSPPKPPFFAAPAHTVPAGATRRLKQPDDLAARVDIDRVGGRHLRQARHGHDVPADHDDELGTCSQAHFPDVHHVVRGRAAQLRVRREGVLRLRYTDRVVSVSGLLQLLDLRPHLAVGGDVRSMVDLRRDRLHLVPQRQGLFVHKVEVIGLLAQPHHFFSDLDGAGAAVRVVPRLNHFHAVSGHALDQQLRFRFGVLGAGVDRDHARQAVHLGDVLDVALQIDQAFLQCCQVLLAQLRHLDAAVIFEGPDGGDDHRRRRLQSGLAALDVDELLTAQIRAESRLGHHVIGELEGRARGHHRVTTVCDVCQRAAVNEGRVVLERLHEVRLERVLQERRHGAVCLEVASEDRLLCRRVPDDDLAEAFLQVLQARGETEDRHHFRGHHDVEAVLPGIAIAWATQAHDDLAQGAIVDVDYPPPRDTTHIEAELVALMDVVVDERGHWPSWPRRAGPSRRSSASPGLSWNP